MLVLVLEFSKISATTFDLSNLRSRDHRGMSGHTDMASLRS
jgi:hypothetical protein